MSEMSNFLPITASIQDRFPRTFIHGLRLIRKQCRREKGRTLNAARPKTSGIFS